ncbi:unnamed protein product [Bursaphelenchus xylophilus]|uniref:(pine wood nematode) hypothetical protein n=1 Tax=Bursaphelenchus xylophilus TaxID=6326 RepID=A0A1I7SCE6_BURXY|nr:unnamed protein product [Bursaphelenchus xylophilus]CAG9094251.1 unnamed protein product [Bursaphelenchus xylophilus]
MKTLLFVLLLQSFLLSVAVEKTEDELLAEKCGQILRAAKRQTSYDSFAEMVLAFKHDATTLANENGLKTQVGPLIKNATERFLSLPESDILGKKLMEFIETLKQIRKILISKADAVELLPFDIPIHYLLILCKENGDILGSLQKIEQVSHLNGTMLTNRFINLFTTSYQLGEYLNFNPSEEMEKVIDAAFKLDVTNILGKPYDDFIASIRGLRNAFIDHKANPNTLERLDVFVRILEKTKNSGQNVTPK